MHYNQFTIDYIEAIQKNLNIQVNKFGEASFVPEYARDEHIFNLKKDLSSIWPKAISAIEIVKTKKDATIQCGLFGLINNLDAALKVGYLLGDRIVLLDYLYERILLSKSSSKIDRTHLGVIASSLVSCLPLAYQGKIVIIPNPFTWFPKTKLIIEEASEKVLLSVEIVSLLNMLSITKECQLHPYTIAESDEIYNLIMSDHIDSVDVFDRTSSQYAYAGILGGLMSERLLNETELSAALEIPLTDYHQIISLSKGFHVEYLNYITSGGALNGDANIDNFKRKFLDFCEKRNNEFPEVVKKALALNVGITGIGGAAIAFWGTTTVISSPLNITASVLGFSATLASLISFKKNEPDQIISVFHKLLKKAEGN